VHLRADDVDAGKWPIQSLALRMRLRDGVLRLEPLEVGFAGGTIAGTVQLDARDSPIDAAANVDVRSVDFEQLLPDMDPANVGRINGAVDLRGRGDSIADMLATADGEVRIGMGRGRVSNLLLELAGLDVAESLKFLLGKDQTVRLRCAYADLALEDGLARSRSIVFDTSDTVLFGEGTVDLGEEKLALELRPEPKDVSPVSLRGPLLVGGTFKDPSFRPEAKSLLARAVAAAALYAIAPPAALLALIETGPGEDVNCFTGRKKGRDRQQSQEAKAQDRKASRDDSRG
jgi:uncharacterized protein involved in outer membrane biogenesis